MSLLCQNACILFYMGLTLPPLLKRLEICIGEKTYSVMKNSGLRKGIDISYERLSEMKKSELIIQGYARELSLVRKHHL